MYVPPPLRSVVDFPLTGGTALFAIGVTAAWWMDYDISIVFMATSWWHGEPWRLVTSAFPHGGVFHLLFNLYWLWAFGTFVEREFGPLKTAGMLVLFAAGSSMGEFAFSIGGVGLSGVGYGLFGFLWMLSRKSDRYYDLIDHQTVVLFIGWFFFCIVATYTGIMSIANVAHAVGAALGILLGWAVAVRGPERQGAVAGLVCFCVLLGLGASIARPYSYFHRPALSASVRYDEEEPADLEVDPSDVENSKAIQFFRQEVEKDRTNGKAWFNLGIALRSYGEEEEAEEIFERAYQLSPDDPAIRANMARLRSDQARSEQFSGRLEEAAKLYQESLAINGAGARTWERLGYVLRELGRENEAVEALAKAQALREKRERPSSTPEK